jgi:uncharacterized YigZ family protein
MNADPVSYLTVDKKSGPFEIREKGSRFISWIYPIQNESQVNAILRDLGRTYHDATHICWSFRIFRQNAEYVRYDDDGEPGGTAGQPIFYELKGRNYYDVLLAVIRYFGGTKLGTGGLAKAYAGAAREVLNNSRPLVRTLRERITVRFPFDFTGEMRHVAQQFDLEIIKQEFAPDGVCITLGIPVSRLDEVERELVARSRGKIKLIKDAPETIE